MIAVFRDSPEHLNKLTAHSACSCNFVGKPLILHNVAKLASHRHIEGVLLPEGFAKTASIIASSYPSMKVDEYKDRAFIPVTDDLLELPLNSILFDSEMGDLVADQMIYP